MNNNYNDQGNWSEVKSKIKAKWSKFTDQEIEGFKGRLDQLADKIQKAYGCPQDQAEQEFNEFQASLRPGKSHQNQNQDRDGGPAWKNQERRQRDAGRPDMSQEDELSASKTA